MSGAEGGRLGNRDRVVVLNPASGDADHADRVRELARERDYRVVETTEEHGGRTRAREVAGDAAVVAAAGGDGTVNQVVHGLADADALDSVSVGVVPCGTGNSFATNVGVESVEHAFQVLDAGRVRRIDLGVATGDGDTRQVFVNSCVGGLTAEASGETPDDLKERVGVLAYVLTTLRLLDEFDGIPLLVTDRAGDALWEGDAALALLGNARGFGPERTSQADVEDGLLEVAIVESAPSAELLEEAAVYRLFGTESDHVTRLQARAIEIGVETGESVDFSFDGELASFRRLDADVREQALAVHVGDSYDPHPG
jgi:YegS/Rv2252/BmrU family lipid kinase